MADNAPPRTWQIYKVTSRTSGKSYIGLTVRLMRQRWAMHLYSARKNDFKGSTVLSNAIRQHGAGDFTILVIATARSLEEASGLERRLIATHQTLTPSGYNIALGGMGSPGVRRPMAPEIKAKISATNKGVLKAADARRKMSVTRRRRITKDETRQKLSDAARRRAPAKVSDAEREAAWSERTRKIVLKTRGKKRTEIDRLLGQIRRKEEALRRCQPKGKCAGVSFEQGRWRVRTAIDGRRREIGSFDTFEEAKVTYIAIVSGHLTFLRSKLANYGEPNHAVRSASSGQ